MSERNFNLEQFLSLDGDSVVGYAEPFVTTETDSVPPSVYESLLDKLDQLNDFQLVYALEICMRISPDDFVHHVIRFLENSSSSVCCTAARLLESYPLEQFSRELADQIESAAIVELFSLHARTGERVRVGTNEELVRKVADRAANAAATNDAANAND